MPKWNPKPEESKENESSGSGVRGLPQLLEQDGDWTKRAIHLLEVGHQLKSQLGEKSDEKKGTEGSGLLGKLSQIEEELRLIQVEQNLEGLRHNNLVFRTVVRDGRETTPLKQLRIELAERGVKLDVLNAAWEAATKRGDPYWVKEWKEVE